ncbi:hypothetical protein Moror_6020 [Moniliophthora roreri MCA 2997]|uniref:Uncharacterized protein n=2 Tax=Moniliophthora roreri TaxID=221103 RepID=V2WKT6_MONRO|nr:hypothetical protein Moror_6020 [Moniliophthora roreri MCA 2997]
MGIIYQTINNGNGNRTSNGTVIIQDARARTVNHRRTRRTRTITQDPYFRRTQIVYGTYDNGDWNMTVNGCILSNDPTFTDVAWVDYDNQSPTELSTEFDTRQQGKRNTVLNACYDNGTLTLADRRRRDWYFNAENNGRKNKIWNNCNCSGSNPIETSPSGNFEDLGMQFFWVNPRGRTFVGSPSWERSSR